jgi:hypothetical protein
MIKNELKRELFSLPAIAILTIELLYVLNLWYNMVNNIDANTKIFIIDRSRPIELHIIAVLLSALSLLPFGIILGYASTERYYFCILIHSLHLSILAKIITDYFASSYPYVLVQSICINILLIITASYMFKKVIQTYYRSTINK